MLLQTTMNTGGVSPCGAQLLLPVRERLLVVAVEAVQRAFELLGRASQSVTVSFGGALRQLVADVVPESQVGDGGRRRVVVDRHARDLDDAGLDGVDQGEVGDHPREDVPSL